MSPKKAIKLSKYLKSLGKKIYIKNRSVFFSCRTAERDCMMPSNPLIVFSFLLGCSKIKPFPRRTNEQQNNCGTAAKLRNVKGAEDTTPCSQRKNLLTFFFFANNSFQTVASISVSKDAEFPQRANATTRAPPVLPGRSPSLPSC